MRLPAMLVWIAWRIFICQVNVLEYVAYSTNALQDLLHINMIKIDSEHRLWLMYQMPMVPLHFFPSPEPFWCRVREHFDAAGALNLSTIRYTDEQLAVWRTQQNYANQAHERLVRAVKLSPQWPQIQVRFETWRDL